ncbi:Uncharacterized membrane protein SpoIIM, required for sporulation [Natronorubrum sediminis]|uniref:Uncharacterized membrane protein SpoIIM, required for sporulation n=1 Tax=Natronorubrum sediminis TaxID=640943 RepID=A0A1H6FR77_9EURY|nr:stage II sporulation protein M [Natronorubrum sediminis]SEH13387.1 Uncharacterized membrane protein SpoIIM, required for sporulation [Natronorubrum sediminis]
MNGSDDDRDGWAETESERREEYGVATDRESERDDSWESDRPTVDLADDDGKRRSSSPTPAGEPGEGRDPSPADPPDSAAIRNWTLLSAALAVISLATAAAIFGTYEAPTATAGAVVLGAGFGLIAIAGRSFPLIFGYLDDAWSEHRRYVGFSAGLFAFGILVGALLYAAGINLIDLLLEIVAEELGEEELPGGEGELADEETIDLSATFFIVNNTPPFLAAIFGALTFGFFTFVIMVFNGIVVGNIAAFTGMESGFGIVIALLAPHGIFELTALFVAAGVGFRFLYRAGERIAGTRDALFTKRYLVGTLALVIFAWLVLVLAAFVEAYVTFLVAEALFPDAV